MDDSMIGIFQNEDMQQQIIRETFQLVSKRDDNVCNFLEGGRLTNGTHFPNWLSETHSFHLFFQPNRRI